MPISITVFTDFVCPFCYVGTGMIDKLSKEFDLDVTWMGYELHPETPPQGVAIEDLVDPFDLEQVMYTLRKRGEPYGLTFADPTWLSNSRLCLEAAEFARDEGRYPEFHHAAFKAYFTDRRDIGDRAVVRGVASACGLDPDALDAALDDGRCRERVAEAGREASRRGVTAIPSFFIEDQPVLTGAPAEVLLRERLQAAANGQSL